MKINNHDIVSINADTFEAQNNEIVAPSTLESLIEHWNITVADIKFIVPLD